MSHVCHRFWKCYKILFFCSLLTRCTIPCACHAEPHLNLQKWSKHVVFLTFWLGKVLRATTVCTFSPELRCFAHFDLEICFVPQRRALFQHLNFQKCSEPGVFCTFWLRNVLRATTACTFSTSQLPEVVYFSTLRSHKSLEKHSVSRLSYLFAHLDLLSSDFLLFDLLFSSILFSDSSHLCFSSVHIVGSLTSKLPEIMIIFHQYSSGI